MFELPLYLAQVERPTEAESEQTGCEAVSVQDGSVDGSVGCVCAEVPKELICKGQGRGPGCPH